MHPFFLHQNVFEYLWDVTFCQGGKCSERLSIILVYFSSFEDNYLIIFNIVETPSSSHVLCYILQLDAMNTESIVKWTVNKNIH